MKRLSLRFSVLLFVIFFASACGGRKVKELNTEGLSVRKISDHVYQHISFLETESFGKVECNGMVVYDGKEAVIFDTPATESASAELIYWVENELHCRIKAIIPAHFHDDCLGGLPEFHKQGIASYANNATIAIAKAQKLPVPQHGFSDSITLKVGNKDVIAAFMGEGHTRDNIIGYFPSERVMFGGCLIKEQGAGKGNLADANVNSWAATVRKIKERFPEVQVVIPGHGNTGGMELFEYTIKLFE